MDPIQVIEKYYPPRSKAFRILVDHCRLVTDKALGIAANHPELNPDTVFIRNAAMLHDIGIFMTNAPNLYCYGDYPYICHGYLGQELLSNEGFPEYGLVCERHTGTGITVDDILEQKLPLPLRNYVPESVEEQIICFADKFYSKGGGQLYREKPVQEIRKTMLKFGKKNVSRFDEWCEIFL